MRAKETLQLRHQLSASGLSLRAAAYDTHRHHVLTFDSHPLRPHVLRLFSLRRELKSVALFDPDPTPQSPTAAPQGRKPLFMLHQHQEKLHEAVVPYVLLQYSPTLDVFVCVYSCARRPKGSSKVPTITKHFILLLEPATLRKLLLYAGPETHSLQCSHFDPVTDRVALASHLHESEPEGQTLPNAPMNVVEILQLSKRLDDRPVWPTGRPFQEPKTLLFIENTRASLRYPDTLTVICAARGLGVLYGAGGDGTDTTTSVLLEWRQNELKGGRLTLVKRVMLQQSITAMALSSCGDWLLVGFSIGLKVWNVNGSQTNESAMFTVDENPYEPTGENVADAQAEVISSIEIATTPVRDFSGELIVATGPEETIVIVTGRDTGDVRHWKFSVERKRFDTNEDSFSSGEHRYPRLSLVGYFHAGGKDQMGRDESPNKFKSHNTLGPPLKTLTLCVTIDMGSCFENLLLVVREDVIHVLKVQTVLYVMQEFQSIEEVYAVRAFGQSDECKLCSLSSTAACKLRLFPLDETQVASSTKLLFISPHTSETPAHVSAMETLTNDCLHLSYVVLAWSSGIVDVYDVEKEKQVLTFHDSQLKDQVCALSVVNYQPILNSKESLSYGKTAEGFLSYRSFEDNRPTDLMTYRTSSDCKEDPNQTRKTFIVVGTESGKLFGWNADVLWGANLTFQTVKKANVRVQTAHSSHIVQLACIDAEVRGKRALMGSVGAAGIVKLWKIPSLEMVGYFNTVEGIPVTPSCLEIMKSQAVEPLYATVGYEDGQLAVWRVDLKRVSFQSMKVSTKHERRVSKICRVSSELVPTGSTEFLSCSLDMTVIHWHITKSGTVQEKRYFDIGAAIVDMILVKEQVIITLAHEVCKFSFVPSSKNDIKQVIKPGALVDSRSCSDSDKLSSEQQDFSDPASGPVDDDEYPNTPTTRSVDDSTEETLLSRQDSRSVDEYLTLHVPSAVLHLEASSSSVIASGTATDSAPVTRGSEEDEGLFRSSNERAIKVKRLEKLQHPSVNVEDLRKYVQDYIVRHGTEGTMAANRITHLLSLKPELPSVKRPGFALAKSLKDLKLSGQTRVNSEQALNILNILFAVSTISNQSFDTLALTCTRKQEILAEKARAQRLREKKQARRKPVVTYNLLGEKYVKWEEIREIQDEGEQNQGAHSLSNSLVVHTPPSPTMRDTTVFSEDLRSDMRIPNPSRSEANVDHHVHETSPAEGSTISQGEILENAKAISTDTKPTESRHYNLEDSEDEDTDSDDESNESESDALSSQSDAETTGLDQEPSSQVEAETTDPDQECMDLAAQTEAPPTTTPQQEVSRRKTRQPRGVRNNTSISEDALVNGIHLSPRFQQFWTKGYCWCGPAPRLHIVWSNFSVQKNNKKTQKHSKAKCEVCHKYLHTLELPRVGYAPHFSRQAMFDIIVNVYSKLTASAHSRLYKSASHTKERSIECSIFSALFEVFVTTYGMRSAVEMKLKLFFVSMCYFVREYDAIAVFGELLGLHTPENTDEYDQAPSTLVALCVCCYAWLYSRGMVVNGDTFSGQLRDQRGKSNRLLNTEVTPATDGTTHWQFVRVEHALLCAQDNLLYPLVSPGFLRNIMIFMQEYAQRLPTRSLRTDSLDFDENSDTGPPRWIELHRFLRLLVGEWKQQNSEFRVVERLLFLYPQRDAAFEGELLEKLRLMLSCFVFYDHERVGAMAISDFENLVYKLRYLWSDEWTTLAVNDTEFDKVIVAIKARFSDLNHDGQLCYLDFWTMLYIVGVKTRSLIHFGELPSFCRNYRLEVSLELSKMVWNYMQLSCTLLLPNGLQIGQSSIDQKAKRQHRRRVGGLHDGTFHIAKTLKGSLSTQELLKGDNTKTSGLFLDGTMPAARQTASTTALDRFRPVSVDTDYDSNASTRLGGREPIVFGARSTGPTRKPVAPLSVSYMGNLDLLPATGTNTGKYAEIKREDLPRIHRENTMAYTNMYVQFPQVAPLRRRIESRMPTEMTAYSAISMDNDSDEDPVVYEDLVQHQGNDEIEQAEIPVIETPTLSRPLSACSLVNMAPIVEEIPIVVKQPASPKPILERRRSTTAVVVVPTIETVALLSRVNSRTGQLIRPSSHGLLRVLSDRLKLEETVEQLELKKVSSRSPRIDSVKAETARDEAPLVNESVEIVTVYEEERNEEPEEKFDEKNHQEAEQKSGEEFYQVQPDESVPILIEEAPEPETVVEVHIELPIVEQPSIVETLIVDVVESTFESNIRPEPVVEVKVVAEIEEDLDVVEEMKVLKEDVIGSTPVEESRDQTEEYPVQMEEIPEHPSSVDADKDTADITETLSGDLSRETEDIAEDVLDPTACPQDPPEDPPEVKESDVQGHHVFRFSQQPNFLPSVAVTNNPYRTAMWNPNEDSDSDDGGFKQSLVTKNPLLSCVGDDSVYSSDEELLVDLVSSKLGKSSHFKEAGNTQILSTSLSKLPQAAATKPLISSKMDSNLQSTQQLQKDKQNNLELIEDEAGGDALNKPFKQIRLNDDAERALYGERVVNLLGEGIAFSQEAEVAQQHKWHKFFDDSESNMFATMRHDLEQKQREQQEAEERQQKLRKKWQEQRDEDLLRLQHSRQPSLLLSSTDSITTGAVDAGFRLRRIHRESCQQVTEELQFGVSVQRELRAVKGTEFFHFYYTPEGHGSILTLKMHVLRGDAEVFMSTETKVPCVTDFMWRSSERLDKESGEGHRIVLYPHDLHRLVTATTANATEAESNTSTLSLRSIYAKQPEVASLRVGFYLSVVALEPGTTFALAVMSSGQKMQASRAIQTVDYLIDRFNMISRSFQREACDSISEFIPSKSKDISSAGNDNDMADKNGDESDNKTKEVRKTDTEEMDSQELKSFQYLLETLSEKKGFRSHRTASILLSGPSKEHLEFVQDEDERLKEMKEKIYPLKSGSRDLDDSISVVAERRLTLQGKRQKLRRVVAAKLQHKLAPLRHKSVARVEVEKSASTGALVNIRLAKTDPQPVAYSLTSLDPLPRSQRFKTTIGPLPQAKRRSTLEQKTVVHTH